MPCFFFVHLHLIRGISHTPICPSGPIHVLLFILSDVFDFSTFEHAHPLLFLWARLRLYLDPFLYFHFYFYSSPLDGFLKYKGASYFLALSFCPMNMIAMAPEV